jgi:hypothetical protein
MRRNTRIVAGASIVLAPLCFGIADQVRMVADPPDTVGMVNPDYGVETAAASLANIQANPTPFLAASWIGYAGVLLTIVALVAIWSLAVGRAPRWAWAGAVIATLGAFGQTVHLASYFGLSQVLAGQDDLTAAAGIMIAAEENAFFMALFVPFILGMLLAAIVQVIALRRARVVPRWALVAVVGGTVLMAVTGSVPWASAVYTVLVVAGFAPAALAMLRADREVVPAPEPGKPMPATAAQLRP